MNIKFPLIGVALLLVAASAFARAPGEYTSGSDFYDWSTSVPSGVTKVAGADVTPDGFDDAFALAQDKLYLIHGPGLFPRWEPIAVGARDFVVTRRPSSPASQGALYSDASGLSFAAWINGANSITHIASTSLWANSGHLCAMIASDGTLAVAGVAASSSTILRGTWTVNGAWSKGGSISETAPITDLALADYSLATSGVELASIAGGMQRIRSQAGAILTVNGLTEIAAHRVFRNEGGGNGANSFLTVVPSTDPYSQEMLFEIFPGGASLPIYSGPWIIGDLAVLHPFVDGGRDVVTLLSSNFADIFRLEDVGSTPGTQTLTLAGSSIQEENYWTIHLYDGASLADVTDGKMACADFDGDGLDDLLILSEANRRSYVYPAYDDEPRFNGLRVMGRDSTTPPPEGLTVSLLISPILRVDVSPLPRGLTAPPNGLQCIAWVRDGLTSSTIDPNPATTAVVQIPTLGQPQTIPLSIPTNYDPASTIVYFEFRAVIADFSGPEPVVSQRSTPVNCVTMSDPLDPLLCTLFTEEPDRYSDDNRGNNGCGGSIGPDGPVILNGFNRRSTIGPFTNASGSPTGGH